MKVDSKVSDDPRLGTLLNPEKLKAPKPTSPTEGGSSAGPQGTEDVIVASAVVIAEDSVRTTNFILNGLKDALNR